MCVSQFTLYHSMKESDSFYFEFETYFYLIVAFIPNLLYLKTLIKLLLIKGNKPDFRSAMSGDKSLELYNQVTLVQIFNFRIRGGGIFFKYLNKYSNNNSEKKNFKGCK